VRFSNHLNGSSDPVAMRALGTERSRVPGKWATNPRTWLVVLLALLAVYRFSLIDRGHFAWGDENRYLSAGRLVDALSAGDYRGAVGHLFGAGPGAPAARPAFIFISVPADLFQRAVGTLRGIGPESPAYYDAASALTVIVTLGVTWVVYVIGCVWTKCRWYGLLAAVIYSLLCNANVWIRHLVPYNVSMLFGLWALWSLSAMAVRGVGVGERVG